MSKRVSVHEGDVFAVPLDGSLYGYGLLFAKGRTSDCILALQLVSEGLITDLNAVLGKPFAFLIHTVDVEIVRGRWQIIGNVAPPQGIRLPEYKTETLEGFKILSYKGEVVRDATSDEIERLDYLRSYSPRMLERALKAIHGLVPWEEWMDRILYKP